MRRYQTTIQVLKELQRAEASQKNLAKLRGKLSGNSEERRERVLRLEYVLREYRDGLAEYLRDYSLDLVDDLGPSLPPMEREA